MNPPVIVCPLSRTGDEIAGDTSDAVALNLYAGTVICLKFRCTPLRPRPHLMLLFRDCPLSPAAEQALSRVADLYDGCKRWPRREGTPLLSHLHHPDHAH